MKNVFEVPPSFACLNSTVIMLDIETSSTKTNAKILSIGAAAIDDVNEEIIGRFYANIDVESMKEPSFVEDLDTLNWWKSSNLDEARQSLSDDKLHILDAIKSFNKWLESFNATSLWSKGITFDAPILENAYNQCKVEFPFKFYQLRCLRSLCHFDKLSIPFEGIQHNALDDAVHEARQYLLFKEIFKI